MTKILTIEPGPKLTDEQIREIEKVTKHPIVFDKDCEELAPAMMKAFKSVAIRQDYRKKSSLKEAVLFLFQPFLPLFFLLRTVLPFQFLVPLLLIRSVDNGDSLPDTLQVLKQIPAFPAFGPDV